MMEYELEANMLLNRAIWKVLYEKYGPDSKVTQGHVDRRFAGTHNKIDTLQQEHTRRLDGQYAELTRIARDYRGVKYLVAAVCEMKDQIEDLTSRLARAEELITKLNNKLSMKEQFSATGGSGAIFGVMDGT